MQSLYAAKSSKLSELRNVARKEKTMSNLLNYIKRHLKRFVVTKIVSATLCDFDPQHWRYDQGLRSSSGIILNLHVQIHVLDMPRSYISAFKDRDVKSFTIY